MLTMLTNHANGYRKKTLISIISAVLFFLIIFQPVFAFAKPIINEDNLEPEEKPGLVEKHFSKFILNVSNSLISIMKAQDVSVLVFQKEEVIDESNTTFKNQANATRDDMVFGIFPEGLFNGIAKIYDVFYNLIPIPIYVFITLAGLFMMFDMLKSPENKSRAKEVILGLIVATLFMRFGHMAWEWIIKINYFIVDAVYAALSEGGVKVTSFISTVWDPTATSSVMKSPSFTTALLVVFALFMTFMINYQYMMRMIILGMLVVLFPVVLISLVIPSRRTVLNTWFTQFTSQVFIQSAHAIALGLFFFALAAAEDLGFWLVLTMFFALPAMADVVQRLVSEFTGEGSSGGGFGTSMKNASGMSGLMAVSMMTKGLFKNQSSNQKDTNMLEENHPKNEMLQGTHSNTHSGVRNGNEGVGSIPTSSALQKSSRPRGMARLGSGIANMGRKMANNPQMSNFVKGASVGGMAVMGSMASSMVTGDVRRGAELGAATGMAGNKTGEFLKGRMGKPLEVGGEVLQSSLTEGQKPLALTKERIGYHGGAQLSDPAEMKRMGQSLIGGKTGALAGSAAGSMAYYGNRMIKGISPRANQNYTAVNDKRDLDWKIGQQEQQVGSLNAMRESAKTNMMHAQAKYGKEHPIADKANRQYNEANANYLGSLQNLQGLKSQQSSFYANQENRRQTNLQSIKEHANATQHLKSERRSSGQP